MGSLGPDRTITVTRSPACYRPSYIMASPTLKFGRKYQRGFNAVTTIAMAGFHAGAAAAFFFIDAGAIVAAVVLYCRGGYARDSAWVITGS